MKTAILFVTHIYNEDIERQIIKLHEETKDFATLYVGFQADKVRITLPDGIRSPSPSRNSIGWDIVRGDVL